MGSKYSYMCPISHNEQETIDNILATTKLSESSLEENLLKLFLCVNGIESKSNTQNYTAYILENLKNYDKLNRNFSIPNFNNFLNSFLVNKQFFQAQQLYFNRLLAKHDVSQTCFRNFVTMLIFYSQASYKERLDVLFKHITESYGCKPENIREFLYEVINLNTDDCLLGFGPFLKKSEVRRLYKVWSPERKDKLFRKLLKIYNKKTKTRMNRSRSINSHRETYNKIDVCEKLNELNQTDSNMSVDIMDNTNVADSIIFKTRKSRIILDANRVIEELGIEPDNESKLYNFLCISINELFGEYIRNWLFEDYCQEMNLEKSNCYYYINI